MAGFIPWSEHDVEETCTEINKILGNNAEPLESVRLVEHTAGI